MPTITSRSCTLSHNRHAQRGPTTSRTFTRLCGACIPNRSNCASPLNPAAAMGCPSLSLGPGCS